MSLHSQARGQLLGLITRPLQPWPSWSVGSGGTKGELPQKPRFRSGAGGQGGSEGVAGARTLVGPARPRASSPSRERRRGNSGGSRHRCSGRRGDAERGHHSSPLRAARLKAHRRCARAETEPEPLAARGRPGSCAARGPRQPGTRQVCALRPRRNAVPRRGGLGGSSGSVGRGAQASEDWPLSSLQPSLTAPHHLTAVVEKFPKTKICSFQSIDCNDPDASQCEQPRS
ncbi:hypothetical protein J1605_000419 [Eschrichtius robustus]|uniref:Uncharacterized protein n=1 Tax=Eschrichtius robustus TaxID=9764 RepID=A0AB34H8V0_ESCRO|nr:hypothetical protein J1605_000419 [Eschrichtius robustus]